MKWVILAAAIYVAFPLGRVFQQTPWLMRAAFVLIGVSPYLITGLPHFQIGIVSWPKWSGFTHGYELAVVDVVALALLLGQRSVPSLKIYVPTFGLYFLAVLLSIFSAEEPTAASFYAWQLARVFLISVVVARACAIDQTIYDAILMGMALGIAMQFVAVVYQRFGLGIAQTPGTFLHQNTLGVINHFVVLPHFALLLAGSRSWRV